MVVTVPVGVLIEMVPLKQSGQVPVDIVEPYSKNPAGKASLIS